LSAAAKRGAVTPERSVGELKYALIPGRSKPLGLAGQISFSIFDFRFAIIDVVQRVAHIGLGIIEITTLSVLILATRCANYQDVFIAGNVYFTDADCYARMMRVRMRENSGIDRVITISRNFP
jgi:hypothetical protein